MLYEGGYNIIELYSATKGMNQDIGSNLISQDHSYYIQNIMPTSLGEGQVRYGTELFSEAPQDTIIDKFPFKSSDGSEQQVIYMNGFQNFATYSNLRIRSSNRIQLTSVNYALFKEDTLLQLRFVTPTGLSPVSYYEIENIVSTGVNTIEIYVAPNSFPDALENFFILMPGSPNPVRISDTQFSITVPMDFISPSYFFLGQLLNLSIDAVVTQLFVGAVDFSVPGTITFTCAGTAVPAFTGANTRILSFQSLTPDINTIANSYGYIKVLDVATNALLTGGDQTLDGLSVACQPRAEFFGRKLWICNGVDQIMTWDGAVLEVYKELVKENTVVNFARVDATHFTCVANKGFKIAKYAVGNTIELDVYTTVGSVTTLTSVTTTVAARSIVGNVVTIQTTDDIPVFTGTNKVVLFYTDVPPRFNYMKGAHDRLWCLGEGAVSLDYRIPDQAMRVYYSYTPYTDETPFRFFNENTKTVPSEEISAKHGCADNLEAIVSVSGYLAFVGRIKTQIWQGIDPLTENSPNSFSWSSTVPAGVFHGNLVVELANDAYFLNQNGFLSFSTFNIAKQFGATSTAAMDKLAAEYINSIDSNSAYRACRSFKYNSGGFCGFKIGQNNTIVSRYHTSLYWWCVFTGDFGKATSFLSTLDDSLYLSIGKKIFRYADGIFGNTLYGDNNGNDFISFIETKYINNLKSRYANKRYEIQSDYSSSVVVNTENTVNIYIRGDLRTSFTLSDLCDFPQRGDVLGTINLLDGSLLLNGKEIDPNNPSNTLLGFRLDAPFQTVKGRLQFLSSNFSVSLVGKVKNGPFVLKRIRLFGLLER